jgi:hypothetical protein
MEGVMDELTTRAMSAYFKAAKAIGRDPDQPGASSSGPETINGKQYVALRSGSRLLAAYRVRGDGVLRRTRRWSKVLEAA